MVRAEASEEVQMLQSKGLRGRTVLFSPLPLPRQGKRRPRPQGCRRGLAECHQSLEAAMATRLASPCSAPGCPNLAAHGSRCADHRSQRQQERGTAHERGYDVHWQRLASLVRRQRPMCQDCGREPTREIHHLQSVRKRPDLRLDPRNLWACCLSCHRIRTLKGE